MTEMAGWLCAEISLVVPDKQRMPSFLQGKDVMAFGQAAANDLTAIGCKSVQPDVAARFVDDVQLFQVWCDKGLHPGGGKLWCRWKAKHDRLLCIDQLIVRAWQVAPTYGRIVEYT